MDDEALSFIKVQGCSEHNLKSISLEIPLRRLTLVCGVSGSGKSTLAYDVLFSEGQGRFLESFSAYARLFQGKLSRSRTESICNIPPALALGQRFANANPRSTVATLTDLASPIRMLFSRFGRSVSGEKKSRSHFSFNHRLGACPDCQGLGLGYELDPDSLIADESLSLRRGALRLSTPNGYIIYSQVTIDVLDQVCRAHGFSVDIPWRELTDEQRDVVLYGSSRLEIPFGKHPLESRLKWTGITPKPRELGRYRGIVPIMEEILRRDPNPSILRFCRQNQCRTCGGLRLNPDSLDTAYRGASLRTLLTRTISQLAEWGEAERDCPDLSRPEQLVLSGLATQSRLLENLSLGHLGLNRSVPTLSPGEGQRIRIGSLLKTPISGMLYVLDEPGSGLHPSEKRGLYRQLRHLVETGGTVVMVSHDRQALDYADWVAEIGPVGGEKGGHLLYSGPVRSFRAGLATGDLATPTLSAWREPYTLGAAGAHGDSPMISLGPIEHRSLEISALTFPARAITVLSGPTGSGKSSLLEYLALQGTKKLRGKPPICRIITIDQQLLGKNVRSNPATYTKLFDEIRKLFASLPKAKELGLDASSFSFNTDQGCCPVCQGAGLIEITMHYLDSLFQPCPQCQGRRYQESVLAVLYRGLPIDEVLKLTIDGALDWFAEEPKIAGRLKILSALGLGYLTLGQPSSTLSGGEAQRVRLASFIHPGRAHGTLYLLDEPCQGLHDRDIPHLVKALKTLCDQGACVIVAENNPRFITSCDWLIELTQGQGKNRLGYCGELAEISAYPDSTVAAMLRPEAGEVIVSASEAGGTDCKTKPTPVIRMTGVRTHNLQNVCVDIPENALTVVCGPSGSGKSSLAFETLYRACQRCYAEHLSPVLRDRLAISGEGTFDEIIPYKPAVALAAQYLEATPRSTVGTLSGIHDALRLLFSRLGIGKNGEGAIGPLHASHFSFNHHDGACPSCKGLGYGYRADASRWVVDPEKGIREGAFSPESTCQHFMEPDGRYMAVLQSAARESGLDIHGSWQGLAPAVKALILEGCPGRFEVTWKFKRGKRSGEHRFHSDWRGLNKLVLADYLQKKENASRKGRFDPVIFREACPDCRGLRLRPAVLQVRVGRISLGEVLACPLIRLQDLLIENGAAFFADRPSARERLVGAEVIPGLLRQVDTLIELGLGYLTLSRAVNSLSSGEHQRLRLASVLGNRLNHSLFILDEISRGLHPGDVPQVTAVLRTLLQGGNTIVAVDHHAHLHTQADWIIELGPGGGKAGGRVTYMGLQRPASPFPPIEPPHTGVRAGQGSIVISSATIHNLKSLDLTIPAAGLTVLCGVSGSGKSTLLHRVIHASAAAGSPVNCDALSGLERFRAVHSFTPRNVIRQSNEKLSDYLGIAAALQRTYIGTGSRTKTKNGTCIHCDGQGEVTTDLDYMGTFVEPCPYCRGSGLSEELCRLSWQGLSLADALNLDIGSLPREITAALDMGKIAALLDEFSLGYLCLGRRMATLSSGEFQRLRLVRLFAGLTDGSCLMLLDEPDSGLGPDECRQLIVTLKKVLARGHAAIVISHHPLMMSQADFLIDLGPGAGDEGGTVTAFGTPHDLLTKTWPLSKTAAYLKRLFHSA